LASYAISEICQKGIIELKNALLSKTNSPNIAPGILVLGHVEVLH
jgi:hypothetical protein